MCAQINVDVITVILLVLWSEKKGALGSIPGCRQEVGRCAGSMGEAGTPSEHYRGTLEQGNKPPNAGRMSCNEIATCTRVSCLHPYPSGIG